MIDKFKIIYKKIVKDKGEPVLFAILKMDEYLDKWTVLISSEWIKTNGQIGAFTYLRDLIKNNMEDEEIASIARIGIFTTDNHLVQELAKIGHSQSINNRTSINGNVVHEGYIF